MMAYRTAGIFIALVAVMGIVWMLKSPEDPLKRTCTNYRAASAAEEFVRRQLKAPSTARFPEYPTKVQERSLCLFSVEGHVDAQNGFGALLRKQYSINVRYDPANKTWHAHELNLF